MTDSPTDAAELLAELRDVMAAMDRLEGRLSGVRARRVELFRALREAGVTFAVIASTAGVTEAAVHQVLRKARAADERAAAG